VENIKKQKAFANALLVKVTKEMAQPRESESVKNNSLIHQQPEKQQHKKLRRPGKKAA
jgi:hypothetical protein